MIASIRTISPTGSTAELDTEIAELTIYIGEARMSEVYPFIRDPKLHVGPDYPSLGALHYLRLTHQWDMLVSS